MNRSKSKHYQDTLGDDDVVDKSIQVRVVNTTNFYRLSTVPMRCGFVSIQTFNIIMLGVSFCILYTAFTPTQYLQSTLNKDFGSFSLGILYAVQSISSFIVPPIVIKIGERKSVFIGAIAFILYSASNIQLIPVFLLVSSAITGLGASLLWTAQASFLTKNSTKETLGRNSGIFFGFYQLNHLLGNIIASKIMNANPVHEKAQKVLFITFTVISFIASLSFIALRPIPRTDDMIDPPLYHFKTIKRLLSTLKVLCEKKFLMLILIIAYNGIFQAFMAGSFTKEVGKTSLNTVMVLFGLAGAIGSFAFGKIIDVLGRKPILIASSVLVLSGSLLCLLPKSFLRDNSLIYYIIALMFGLGDSSCFTVLYATVGNLFSSTVEPGFGAFKLVQSLAASAFFFVSPYITVFYFEVLIVNIFMLIGLLFFLLLDFFVADVDKEGSEIHNWSIHVR